MSREHTPDATQAAPSHSLIHFFWTGKIPSQKLQRHLLHWQRYLSHQNSEFRVCLWVTGDLHEKMRENQHTKRDTDGDLAIGTPSIKIKNIDPLFAEAAIAYPELTEVCRKLVQAKLYSFVSSFARMLILNRFPGFYCDTDIQPSSSLDVDFPKSLDELKTHYSGLLKFAFCYNNGRCTENQIMLSLFENIFSHRLSKKNAEIAELKSNPDSPFSDVDAFIRANQTAIDKIKSMLSTDPFLQKNARWITDFKEPKNVRTKEAYTFSTNGERIKIKQAHSLFQLFYKLSIKHYDTQFAEANFPILYNIIQNCFRNPTQDGNNVYAWSHPIYFQLDRLRQSANVFGTQYSKKIIQRRNAGLFSEQRAIPPTANLNTLYKAIAEKDWYYAIALAKTLHAQLSQTIISDILSAIIIENSPLHWQVAQLQCVNFLCDHCDTQNEAIQETISAVIKLALRCAKNDEMKQLVVNTLHTHLSLCIASADDIENMLPHLNQDKRIALFHALETKLPDLFPFYADVPRMLFHLNQTEENIFSTLLSKSLERENGQSHDSLENAIACYTKKANEIALSVSAENISWAKRLLLSPRRLNKTELNHLASCADHLSQRELRQFILALQMLSDAHFIRIVQKLTFSGLCENLLSRIVLHANSIRDFNFGFLRAQADFSAICFFAEYDLHDHITRELIGDGSVLQRDKPGTSKTPIELAATEQHWSTVQKIASLHRASSEDAECYCSALTRAAASKQWATCKTLIEQGAALTNHFKLKKTNGLYPIHLFIRYQQHELVALAISRSPTIRYCTTDTGKTAIEYAADKEQWGIVVDIARLESLAANDSTIYGNVLLLAALKQEWEVCFELICQGANLECREPSQGYKPIHLFAAAGKGDLLDAALQFHADGTKRTHDGKNIMQLAADHGHHAVLQTLEGCSLALTIAQDSLTPLRQNIARILNTGPKIQAHTTRPQRLFQRMNRVPLTTPTQLSLLVRYASTLEDIQGHLERVLREAIASIPTEENYIRCLRHCIDSCTSFVSSAMPVSLCA